MLNRPTEDRIVHWPIPGVDHSHTAARIRLNNVIRLYNLHQGPGYSKEGQRPLLLLIQYCRATIGQMEGGEAYMEELTTMLTTAPEDNRHE